MGAAGLCGFRGTRFLRAGAQVLRLGALVEVSQARPAGRVAGRQKTGAETIAGSCSGSPYRPASGNASTWPQKESLTRIPHKIMAPADNNSGVQSENKQHAKGAHPEAAPTLGAATEANWGSAFRVAASDKWRSQSAAMGRGVTDAICQFAAPRPG